MPDCQKCGRTYAESVRFCVVDGTDLSAGGGRPRPAPTFQGPGPEPAASPGGVETASGIPTLGPGTVLGNYRIVELLGEGGMGQVFAAEHMRLGRKVAIKTLRAEFGQDQTAVDRFFSEARTVNQIRQEHIVEITDFVDDDPHHTYCVMELLEGRTLHEELQLAPGGLERSRVLVIAKQVAEAMAEVHDTGVVHRDLKPANIFITHRAGQPDWVKLLDFGIAKLQRDGLGAVGQAQTVAGSILGTPEYMSPEQASGKTVDPRTDIYALGVILFEMVTGSQPFRAGSLGEMVVQHLTVAPPRPSQCIPEGTAPVESALEALILACLEKDPENRPESMAVVQKRLEAIGVGEAPVDAAEENLAGKAAEKAPERVAGEAALAGSKAQGASVAPSIGSAEAAPTDEVGLPPKSGRRWPLLIAGVGGAAAVLLLVVLIGSGPGEEAPAAPGAADGNAMPVTGDIVPASEAGEASAPAPEPPSKVTIALDSTPPGARVFRTGEPEPLGVTPMTADLPRQEGEEATFEFKLDGYQEAREAVSLSESSRVEVVLDETPPPRRTTRPRQPRRRPPQERQAEKAPAERPTPEFDPSGIIDPFSESD